MGRGVGLGAEPDSVDDLSDDRRTRGPSRGHGRRPAFTRHVTVHLAGGGALASLVPPAPHGSTSERPPPPPVPSPSNRPSQRPARTSSRPSLRPSLGPDEELPVASPRDRFSVGLILPFAIAALAANAIGGLLAPGWVGVAGERAAARWQWWAAATPLTAALIGIGTTIALVMAAVANPRTSVSTRVVATFGAGLVLTLVAAAFRAPLEPTHLIVLFAGAFAVLVASAVEAIAPPFTRAVGVLLGVLAVAALLRVVGWGLAWTAAARGHAGALPWAQVAASAALVLELVAQMFLALYLVYRPGWRGALSIVLAIAAAFLLAMWTLRTDFDPTGAGGLRDAFQRAVSLRVQGGGPVPGWIDRNAAMQEIALLDPTARLPLLPLVFAELASITLPIAAILGGAGRSVALYAVVALAVMSRGQVDAPLRALELAVAALGALVLSRGARVRYATTARGSERPPAP